MALVNLRKNLLQSFYAIGHYRHVINCMYMDKLIDFNCICQLKLAIMGAEMAKL